MAEVQPMQIDAFGFNPFGQHDGLKLLDRMCHIVVLDDVIVFPIAPHFLADLLQTAVDLFCGVCASLLEP